MKVIAEISLEFCEGSSDKFYKAQLVESDTGNFQFGRNGTAGQSGVKYTGDSESDARKTYDKVVAEKVAKGYIVIAAA